MPCACCPLSLPPGVWATAEQPSDCPKPTSRLEVLQVHAVHYPVDSVRQGTKCFPSGKATYRHGLPVPDQYKDKHFGGHLFYLPHFTERQIEV